MLILTADQKSLLAPVMSRESYVRKKSLKYQLVPIPHKRTGSDWINHKRRGRTSKTRSICQISVIKYIQIESINKFIHTYHQPIRAIEPTRYQQDLIAPSKKKTTNTIIISSNLTNSKNQALPTRWPHISNKWPITNQIETWSSIGGPIGRFF